jgi:hypothetical protein
VPNLSLSRSAGGHFQFVRAALRLGLPLTWAAIAFAGVGLVVGFTGADLSGGFLANGGATHPLTGLCLIVLAGCVLRTKRRGLSSMVRIGVLTAILCVSIARLMDGILSSATGSVSGGLFGPVAGFGMTFYGGSIGGFALLSMGFASLAMVSVYSHRPFLHAALLSGDVITRR